MLCRSMRACSYTTLQHILKDGTTIDPGYIKLEGYSEVIQYTDNSKYKRCLLEARLKTMHVSICLPKLQQIQ